MLCKFKFNWLSYHHFLFTVFLFQSINNVYFNISSENWIHWPTFIPHNSIQITNTHVKQINLLLWYFSLQVFLKTSLAADWLLNKCDLSTYFIIWIIAYLSYTSITSQWADIITNKRNEFLDSSHSWTFLQTSRNLNCTIVDLKLSIIHRTEEFSRLNNWFIIIMIEKDLKGYKNI